MKTVLLLLGVCLSPNRARADALPWDGADIVQVVLSDFFQSTFQQGLTETINMSFQFYQTPPPEAGFPPDRYGIIPGTLVIDAQGFLPGTFTSTGAVSWSQNYMPFSNGPGAADQFEIRGHGPGSDFFVPGVDNATDIYFCRTLECQAALGSQSIITPAAHAMTVTRVPEPGGMLTLLVDLIGLAFLAYLIRRWGRAVHLLC